MEWQPQIPRASNTASQIPASLERTGERAWLPSVWALRPGCEHSMVPSNWDLLETWDLVGKTQVGE